MKGIHHLGLAVSNLEESCDFFCNLLGFSKVRVVEDYPAIFVSNGVVMFTLWKTNPGAVPFDRKNNVGLHHVAIAMESEMELNQLYKKLVVADSVCVEFPPELLRGGPSVHMMCVEPSGIRVEFIWSP